MSNLEKAREAGETKYIGKPCKKGHSGLRYVISSACVECLLGYIPKTSYNKKYPAEKNPIRYRQSRPKENMLNGARNRAKSKGIEFNLSSDDITIPTFCPVLGTEMENPSLDRINPLLGYTKGNICVISFRANRLKNNATIEELEAILAYMKRGGAT